MALRSEVAAVAGGGAGAVGHRRSGIGPPSVAFVVGALAAADAFQPSLQPTPPVDRGLAAGAAAVTAGAAARAADGVMRTAAVRSFAGLAGVFVATALRRRQDGHLGWASVRTAGIVTAASAATGLTLSVLRRRPLLAWALTSAAVAATLRDRLHRHAADGVPSPDAGSVATSLAVAAGTVGGASAATRTVGSSGFAAAASVLGAAASVRTLVRHHEGVNNRMEPGYADPPTAAEVSGSPFSAVDFATLGAHGRRFVLEATPADRIADIIGEPAAAAPVRVYVGYRSAATMEARIDLAIDELRRTGAFARSLIVVASPSGTGYVNYIAAEACEYLARGDSAWVAVQYGMRPSILSVDRLAPGGHHHRALLQALAAERRRLGSRSRVVVFGESLGAHAGQNALLHGGTAVLDALGVERALYLGTPYRSKWRSQVLTDGNHEVGRFGSIADVDALDPGARERLRVFLLDHHDDPVTKFGIDLVVQRPPWLGPSELRPATISSTQRWTPIVTFWQTMLDTKNAATVLPGRFGAGGHDYRADLARFVSVAFTLDDVTERQMVAIEERLRRSDALRTSRVDGEVPPPPPVIP